MRVVSLTEAFRDAIRAGQHPFLPHDGHWTPQGHAIAARAVLASELSRF